MHEGSRPILSGTQNSKLPSPDPSPNFHEPRMGASRQAWVSISQGEKVYSWLQPPPDIPPAYPPERPNSFSAYVICTTMQLTTRTLLILSPMDHPSFLPPFFDNCKAPRARPRCYEDLDLHLDPDLHICSVSRSGSRSINLLSGTEK